jgi:hypothetical protein
MVASGSIFLLAAISNAGGLETIVHHGPSIIGIDTIYISQGKIPLAFLQGVGVPNSFINALRGLVAENALGYYTCFISYAREDLVFVEKLRNDLRNNDIQYWRDVEDMMGGEDVLDAIFAAIDGMDKLLVVLSEPSIASPWVKREVRHARERADRDGKNIIIPLRIDDACFHSKEAWVQEILSKHVENFCGWKDDNAYQKALESLLRDLKAASTPT